MKYFSMFITSLIILIIVGGFAYYYVTYKKNIRSIDSDQIISIPVSKVELADTVAKREQGLMYRQSLCQTCGMLFVFDSPQVQAFWMKNTYISLDMIFIDQSGKIVSIATDTVPQQESPSYVSKAPALYVLEVPAGFSKTYKLAEQDRLDIQKLKRETVPFEDLRV